MAKCYIITCAACGGLHEVARRDVMTCSPRCRTWLKRHPQSLEELRKLCEVVTGATPFLRFLCASSVQPSIVMSTSGGGGSNCRKAQQVRCKSVIHPLVVIITEAVTSTGKLA